MPSTEQQQICSCDIRITQSTVLYVWVRLHLPQVESPLQTDISGLCFSRPSPPTVTFHKRLPKHWLFKQPSLAKARWFCIFCGVTMSGSAKTENRPRWSAGHALRGAWEVIASLSHFPDFYTKQALKVWRSPLHAVFTEMSKERLGKSERTPPGSWRLSALAYSRDRPYKFSCLSALSKNGRFRSFFSDLGVIWRVKAFRDQQCQFLTRNKSLSSEDESNCSLTSEWVRTDLILPRGAGVPAKISTRENVHLTILRQRILIRRQNSPVKRSRENVHQPQIWTPNSLHFAHVVHYAHGRQNPSCWVSTAWQGFCPLPD